MVNKVMRKGRKIFSKCKKSMEEIHQMWANFMNSLQKKRRKKMKEKEKGKGEKKNRNKKKKRKKKKKKKKNNKLKLVIKS
jgi:hypothetical protein